MEKYLSQDNELPFFERVVMKLYFWLKEISLSEERGFGLDPSNVTVEKFPLIVSPVTNLNLKRNQKTRYKQMLANCVCSANLRIDITAKHVKLTIFIFTSSDIYIAGYCTIVLVLFFPGKIYFQARKTYSRIFSYKYDIPFKELFFDVEPGVRINGLAFLSRKSAWA